MTGPYATDADAVADLTAMGVVEAWRACVFDGADGQPLVDYLTACLAESGVTLGACDQQVVEWLARGELHVVQVIADWVRRAHEAGRAG